MALIKNLVLRFQVALIEKNSVRLDSLFVPRADLRQKDATELRNKIFSQETSNLQIADKRFEIHDSQARVIFTVRTGNSAQKMSLYLVKYKKDWWIVNYAWE